MSVRDRIAKRISGLKAIGVRTPIIDEVSLPAEVLSVGGYTQPSLDVYREAGLRDILELVRNFPAIAYGTAFGAEAGRWYRVTHLPIRDSVPVAIGLGRAGEISVREIIRVKREDLREKVGTAYKEECQARLGDWGILNWARDAICSLNYHIGRITGAWLEWMWDLLVQPQIDKVADAINARLNDLYNMWGIPTNMAITPLHLRNITDTGFDFQSYGSTTCYWICVGKSG